MKIIFLLLQLSFMSCISLAGIAGPERAIPIRGQDNTYLKFRIQAYDQDREAKENRFLEFNRYRYQAVIELYDANSPVWNNPYPINPSQSYFEKKEDGQHLGLFWQFFAGNRRENFRFDCEYWIPLPAGENEFSFMVNDFGRNRRGYLRRKFLLPPDHSIRLSIIPLRFGTEDEEIAWKRSKGWPEFFIKLWNRPFDLQATVEPNIPGEVDQKCDPIEEKR